MAILKMRDAEGNVHEILALKGDNYVLTEDDKQEIAALVGGNVDFSNYVTKDDIASKDNAGIVYINSAGGINVRYGVLQIEPANESIVAKKQSNTLPLTSKLVDQIVKVGITTNTKTLTDEEKTTACNWLGAVTQAYIAELEARIESLENKG